MAGMTVCSLCAQRREQARNAQPKRQAYKARAYRAQPKHGVCWLCGKQGADTRDHIVPIAVQVRQSGMVTDHRTRPAHRSCNSGRGARASTYVA